MTTDFAHGKPACGGGLVVGLLLLVAAPLLMAQSTGQFRGAVTDAFGSPVPFAMITVTSIDSARMLSAVSGMDGSYRIAVPPGNYRIKFESSGYRTGEIPRADVVGPWVVTENCELEADDQTQGNPTSEPAQKPAPNTSHNPQEPSLEDLGISPTQAKGNAQTQALLDKRSHMLKVHQRLGLITIAPFAATLVTSAFAGGRQTSSTTRDVHAALGTATVGMYIATAYFAIRAPKIAGTKTRGPIRLHKTLAWIHGPGMVLTPILGEMAFTQKSNGQKVHGIASLHGPVAIVTAGAFGLAVASVLMNF